jgi:RNA polymerase sigma-70 factor (sigma-E family)
MQPSTPSGTATFEEYVAARGRWVERIAFLLTGDPHLAQDLTQLTLLQAFRNWSAVESAQHPDAYVRQILVNQLRTHQRRKAWTEVVTDDPPQPDWGTDRPIDGVDERLRIETYLRGLPPRSRAVVVLRYFEDLEVSEVASTLGITASAVRATASRALDRLAQVISQEETQ